MKRQKLEQWVAAGLISASQADAIAQHEAAQNKPWLQWAVFSLGGLAIALGIVALVASNWDAIPGAVKLAVHFVLLLGAAAWVYHAYRLQSGLWLELAVMLFVTLILTAIALIGQVFQLSSPLWRPLLFWLVLATPLLVLAGRGTLTALTWSAIYALTVESLGGEFRPWLKDHAWLAGLYYVAPLLLAASGIWASKVTAGQQFWRVVGAAGLVWLIVISVLPYGGAVQLYADHAQAIPFVVVAIATLLAVAYRAGTREASFHLTIIVCAIAATIGDTKLDVLQAIIFIAVFAAIAWATFRDGHITFTKLCIGIIAIRIVMIYFEVFGSLAETGLGLIISGLFVIGVAHSAFRFTRKLPPQRTEASGGAKP